MVKNKRFIIIQDGNNFTVRDSLKCVHMGMFEFKENEFPVFACFCRIIDLLNDLNDENEQLKQFQEKVFNLINTKIEECEKDYNRAVKSGMPSSIIYDEIESLEWLKKELEE